MTKDQAHTEGDTLTVERTKAKKPRKYFVVMHNDDYTTQEFVVHVLVRFFHKNQAEATQLMLAVHLQGKAKVGVYTKDIADSKVAVVTSYARQNGMPLLLTVEPE
jgi:ATP-dependent Clp protease adaptor protein ClpS